MLRAGIMRESREPADEELAARAKRGDADAWERLVRRHLRAAMALAWQHVRSVEDAEDVVQDAFHRAVRALDSFDERRSFAAWFFTIVRNTARTAIGRDARRAAVAPFTLLETEPAESARRDSGLVLDLETALGELSPMQQAVVRLCDVEGFTSGEAGDMLGVSEGTVRTHLHRARHALRAALGPGRGRLGS